MEDDDDDDRMNERTNERENEKELIFYHPSNESNHSRRRRIRPRISRIPHHSRKALADNRSIRYHSIPATTNETKTCTHLGRREHATTAAHVTESPLTRAVGTTTRDARNARHRATGTPRFGRRLVPRLVEDGVRLAIVLVQPGGHGVDDIRADRGEENFRERDGGAAALDGDNRERGWHVDDRCDAFVPLNLRRREADARDTRAIFVRSFLVVVVHPILFIFTTHLPSGKKTCV